MPEFFVSGVRGLVAAAGLAAMWPAAAAAQGPIELGTRRELFVDRWLLERTDHVRLVLSRPVDQGPVLQFDRPWEGLFCGYCTVIQDGPLVRAYYRGRPDAGADGDEGEVTCYAESRDGVHWTKPDLGLFEVRGSRQNNVVLASAAPATHNFSPFLDANPAAGAQERFKALGGTMKSGLVAYASADGIHWRRMGEGPVIARSMVDFPYMFDSQNVAHWSAREGCYECFFRVFKDKIRRIARTTSGDFAHWTKPELMEYRHDGQPAPIEHLYTNQTHPYFRAPHLGLAIAARFMPGRRVLTEAQAEAIHVHPRYFQDCSDAILMTTRGGAVYDRTFLEGFLRPGVGAQNWVSRTNYPALGIVQTGPAEMSIYANQDYGQPTAHLHRYTLRLDGFASLESGYEGGEALTRLLTFTGSRLLLNFATSAAGSVRVELQDAQGRGIPGFTLSESQELIGNEIERTVAWQGGEDVSRLAGRPLRIRLALKDANVYALRFAEE